MIGGGAIGCVYMGVDTFTSEKVAIKELREELVASMPELVERFRREGEMLVRLNHPNIVKILATVEEEQHHYIIMEYVGGGSLADLIQREHDIPIERVLTVGMELADALSRAHHLDILHRDIKPGNVLIAEDGTPRLTDFGLARLSGAEALTTSGSILGTFPYLSPEASTNQKLDQRSDIWSFGILLYEMLTGEVPFRGETPFEIIWSIKNQSLPDPRLLREGIPDALIELIKKMLMKDREARIPSARLVGGDLEMIQKRIRKFHTAPLVRVGPQAVPAPKNSPPSLHQNIRVIIVDDHAVVRQGLQTFINLQNDMEVIGEAENGLEGVELTNKLQPDIVLLDLVMPKLDGVEATKQIAACSPNTKVLILTSFGEDEKVFPALKAGAHGYLLKDIHPNELVRSIRESFEGKAQLHPDIIKKLMSAVSMQETRAPSVQAETDDNKSSLQSNENLTARELEVLQMIGKGFNNREIAEKLVISETTVKTHVSHLLGKLGVEDRTQAAIWAVKHGLVEED